MQKNKLLVFRIQRIYTSQCHYSFDLRKDGAGRAACEIRILLKSGITGTERLCSGNGGRFGLREVTGHLFHCNPPISLQNVLRLSGCAFSFFFLLRATSVAGIVLTSICRFTTQQNDKLHWLRVYLRNTSRIWLLSQWLLLGATQRNFRYLDCFALLMK